MVLNNAFVFNPGQYAGQNFVSAIIVLLAFQMLLFTARYSKLSLSDREFYQINAILLAVKSEDGFFFFFFQES